MIINLIVCFLWHAKGIDKTVRRKFASIPANLTLKPITVRKSIGCGLTYKFIGNIKHPFGHIE